MVGGFGALEAFQPAPWVSVVALVAPLMLLVLLIPYGLSRPRQAYLRRLWPQVDRGGLAAVSS